MTHLSSRHLITFAQAAFIMIAAALIFSMAPDMAHAATSSKTATVARTKLEVSGWLPYWKTEQSVADVLPHLSQLTEVNPFGYTVKTDGTLNDALKVNDPSWQKLFKAAKKAKVRVVPTIMWSDTNAIHTVLSDDTLRATHVAAIVKMVKDNGFDGVDIDYEGKKLATGPYYTKFLKELSAAMAKDKANRWVMCTIEARTPPESLYASIPADLAYGNDFKAINQYCDRVRLMTYDQDRADLKLNAANKDGLYAPISDAAWVKKVIELTIKDIDPKKLMIGVPTYGAIYQVMPNYDGSGYSYTKTEAFNPGYAAQIAKEYGITPTRNSAGEMSLSYVPKELPKPLPTQAALSALAPRGTSSANLAAAGALALVKAKKQQAPVTLLSWSDAGAIAAKVALARQYGLRGVSVFKMDGGEDQKMWDVLK